MLLSVFPSPAPFRSFPFSLSLSLRVFSLNFGGVFEGRDPQMYSFGLSKRADLSSPDAPNTIKFREWTPRERQKERKWGREREKREMLGGPAEGESGEGGPAGGVRGAPKSWTHPRKFWTHTAPTRHTTQQQRGIPHKSGLGQGWSLAGRSMAQRTRHEQQNVPKSSPNGQHFQGSRMVRNRIEKIPKSKKNGKNLSSSLPNQKWTTKSNKWKNAQKNIFKKRKMFCFLLFFFFLCFFIIHFKIFVIFVMFWDFGQPKTLVSRKKHFVSRKNFVSKKSCL